LGDWQKVAGKRQENILILKRIMSMLIILWREWVLITTEGFFILEYDAASMVNWSLMF